MSSYYLQAVINQQAVGLIAPLTALHHFNPLISQWAHTHLLETKLSGSHAKTTAVKCSADVDIFISLSPNLNMTLVQIYDDLFNFFNSRNYSPRRQNVSIRVSYNSGTVDLVPGKRQNFLYSDHSLCVRKGRTWTQTNIDTHIATITNSGRTNIIKLIKIWRERQGLEFPSLYLELAVIRALQVKSAWDLEGEFKAVMAWLFENIETARVVDPANSNNILSDDLTAAEKRTIALKARLALIGQDLNQAVW